jgi:hypothetical protein
MAGESTAAGTSPFALRERRDQTLVADGFYADPDALREHAMGLDYGRDPKTGFPGMRCPIPTPPGVKEVFESWIGEKVLGINSTLQYQPAAETKNQFIHGDLTDWAGVVYLNPDSDGRPGTSFWRHRALGLWRNPEGFDLIEASMRLGIEASVIMKTLQGDRFDESKWEELETVPMKYNRLVLYEAKRFHRNATAFGTTVRDARLVNGIFAVTREQSLRYLRP